MTFTRLLAATTISTVAIGAFAIPAQADLVQAGTFRNLTYLQAGAIPTATGGFFNAAATEANIGDFDSASLTVNGGSPIDLPLIGEVFGIGPSFATKADMDAAFPVNGTYVITALGGGGPSGVTLNFGADAYTADIPALAATSFAALQGLDTSTAAFNLIFNSFTPDAASTSAFTFFTIFGSSQGCGFLAPTATSCAIDPSALTPGTTYQFELDFSDRIENFQGDVLGYTDFDVRTDGFFTTAALTAPPGGVPEPMSLSIFGAGLASAAAMRRRKKA